MLAYQRYNLGSKAEFMTVLLFSMGTVNVATVGYKIFSRDQRSEKKSCEVMPRIEKNGFRAVDQLFLSQRSANIISDWSKHQSFIIRP